jgi:hypothetical protein
MRKTAGFVLVAAFPLLLGAALAAQQPGRGGRPSPVEKIREGVFRVGSLQVDMNLREARVEARVNKDVTTLEFVANTENGNKAYESALTIKSDGRTFNTAILLLGVNPKNSKVPKQHFDPVPPKGDPLELWLEWSVNRTVKRIRVEELLYDKRSKKTLPAGPWVYTGSALINGHYMADVDGVLIGFVHSPSPVIENPRSGAVAAYGSVVLNTNLGISPETPLTLVIKAIGPPFVKKK